MADPYGDSRGDGLAGQFWAHLSQGEFVVQRCHHCGLVRFPPTNFCPRCQGVDWSWMPVSGEGTLWTYTTVRVAPQPELEADVPYHLGVVQLTEGPLVLGRLEGVGQQPVIGSPLALAIEGDRYHFRPA